MRNANVLILTDDTEFARLLSACWRTERYAPAITVLNGKVWKAQETDSFDLVVLGPLSENRLHEILGSIDPTVAVILCAPADSGEMQQLRGRYPRLLHVPLREDWAQTLLLVAGESLERVRAGREARQARKRVAKIESEAVLGRYMLDLKPSLNNALTSILGNAELLLLEPGQLSQQCLHQIKTMHSMTLRIHEIMQRFSSLASEMREAENASHAETAEEPADSFRRR